MAPLLEREASAPLCIVALSLFIGALAILAAILTH